MEIVIKADPKEIADLVLAIQGQPRKEQTELSEENVNHLVGEIVSRLLGCIQ